MSKDGNQMTDNLIKINIHELFNDWIEWERLHRVLAIGRKTYNFCKTKTKRFFRFSTVTQNDNLVNHCNQSI